MAALSVWKTLTAPPLQAQRGVRDRQAVVDADDPPEPAAALAGAHRGIERECARQRLAVADAAGVAGELGGEGLARHRLALLPQHVHADLALPVAQRRLDGLDEAPPVALVGAQPVLDDADGPVGNGLAARLAALVASRLVGPLAVRLRTDVRRRAAVRRGTRARAVGSRVALTGEPVLDLARVEVLRHRNVEGDHHARVRGPVRVEEAGRDVLGRVAAYRLPATAAVELGGAREQELDVIVELGHRADRRARGAHGVGLIDRDRGRNAGDAIDLRLVHPVEKLARVGREGLDVAPLPFRVDGVEGEGRLAAAADAGDHDQLAVRELQVEVLEVVLTGVLDDDVLAHARGAGGRTGRRRTKGTADERCGSRTGQALESGEPRSG